MPRVITVTSGKGGVGKTTTAINLATALSKFGRNVIVLDANITAPHIGLHLGSPRVPVSIHDVLDGKYHIKHSVYRHPSGLRVVPGSISVHNIHKSIASMGRLRQLLEELNNSAELVIVDSAAGLGYEALAAIRAADQLIVVTTPELSAVADALRVIKLAERFRIPVIGVVLNKVKKDKLEMNVDDVEAILETRVIAVIPEDNAVRASQKLQHPVVHSHPKSEASVSFKRLAALLLGKSYVKQLIKEEKNSLYTYVLKRLGLR